MTPMGVKPDRWVLDRCRAQAMIESFTEHLVREEDGRKIISYGPSSYGYDIRCGLEFKLFTNLNASVVDPKGLDDGAFVTVTAKPGEPVLIPPNSFALTHSLEYLRIPRDVLCFSTPKSSYARAALLVPTTVLEPEWEGHLTIEVSNTSSLPARVWPGEGISQLVFFGADLEMRLEAGRTPAVQMRGGSFEGFVELIRETCEVSYADRGGKYQGQKGITLPKA